MDQKILREIERGSLHWWFDHVYGVPSFNNIKVIPIIKRILGSIKNENSPLQIRVTKNQIEIYRERDGSIVKKMPNDVKEKTEMKFGIVKLKTKFVIF